MSVFNGMWLGRNQGRIELSADRTGLIKRGKRKGANSINVLNRT